MPGVVTHFIDVAVDEGHGAEVGQTRASKPWKERRWIGPGLGLCPGLLGLGWMVIWVYIQLLVPE